MSDLTGVAGSPTVSIIIPALNEASSLPLTLAAIDTQTQPPSEVFVADAGSTDGTVALGLARGCRVVEGGLPAVGRNAGAREASGEWLLFVDADVWLPPSAIQDSLDVAERLGLDALSCWFAPDSDAWPTRLSHSLSAAYFWLSTKLRWPHSIGGYLMVRRGLHEAIGGFDESILVAEDQDYVRRAGRVGRYGFVRRPVVVISVRRFRQDGALRAHLRWLGIEAHRLVLGEVRRPLFRYFDDPPKPPAGSGAPVATSEKEGRV